MGNVFVVMKPILHGIMKVIGMKSQLVEIEPGTIMHFWVPTDQTVHTTKPAVVFLHGFVANGIMTWLFQMVSLRTSFAVCDPDLLFFGDSITDRPKRSTSFQAHCVAKGMIKLGVEKFSLVGFSYGGIVGFKLAELYPHMVESMVMSSMVTELTESISNALLNNIGFTNWPDFLLPKTIYGVKVLLSIGSHKFPWFPDFLYRDFLERIYFLYEDDDKIFNQAVSDAMKAFIFGNNNECKKLGENTIVEYIKGGRHLVQSERPRTYNRCLKKFLSYSRGYGNM